MTPPPSYTPPLYTFNTFFIYIDLFKEHISGTLISSLIKKCTAFSGNNNNHSSSFLQKFQITNILKSRVNDVYISQPRVNDVNLSKSRGKRCKHIKIKGKRCKHIKMKG